MRQYTAVIALFLFGGVFVLGLLALASMLGPGVSQADDATMHNCPQPNRWAVAVWGGDDGTNADQAFATCGEGAVIAAYDLDPQTQGWSRWFADQPDISTLSTLDKWQGVIALGGTEVPASPTPTPSPSPSPTPTPTLTPTPTPTPTPTLEDYEFVRATTARDVQESSPWDSIDETAVFDEADPYVYAWLYFEHITVPTLCVRASWYLPDDSFYNSNEECGDRSTEAEDWWHKFWFWHEIAGTDWADIKGTYTVKLSVDSGSGYSHLTSLHFTIV